MVVRFPLSKSKEILLSILLFYLIDLIGSASFVVLDTDYDNYGLVCTCQVNISWDNEGETCSLLVLGCESAGDICSQKILFTSAQRSRS